MTQDKTLRVSELPRLVVHLPNGKEVHHPLAGTEITIGRDPSNRICVSDHFVSKLHAKLRLESGRMTLVDLGSANKTYVNGRPISESPVRYGDAIQFAGVHCRLMAPESVEKAVEEVKPPVPARRQKPQAQASRNEVPRAREAAPPKPKAAAKDARGRSAPPPVAADPMKRLLTIGGLLIAVSFALALLLRILLVPSETPAEDETESETVETVSTAPTPSVTTAPPVDSPISRTGQPVASAGERGAEFYFDEALSYLDTGRLKEARESFEKVLEIDPDHPRAGTRLSLLNEEIEKRADRHFNNARQAFQFLRYQEAIAEWEMFLLLAKPDDPRYAEAQQGIEQAKAKLR